MFAGWGSWVARFRWPVLSVALVAVIGAGIWGLGVFGQLTEGGYQDPNSESSQAAEAVEKAFGAQGGDVVVLYTPVNAKIDDVELGKRIRTRLALLPKSAVTGTTSYWQTKSSQFAAKDKTSGIALVTLAGADDGAKLDAYRDISGKLAVEGATVQLSGAVVLADATSTRSTEDLAKAEIISLPVTLILLLFLFGSLVAASLPVLVGGAAVLGSLGILHAVAGVHEVNSFAVNVASLLGLGMAIDYGLFMVGRFREEQAAGRSPAEAVRRTVATAGRTVVFSATLLMIALGGLLLFPQGFLKSLAYGGLAAVGLAALLSLTLLPALLAVLGPRVDKLPVRLPGRGREVAPQDSFWGRIAAAVLRRPVVVVLPILAGLLVLAAPIAGVRFGEADERTLPAGDPARVAIETLKAGYPQFTGAGLPIVLRGDADISAFAVMLRQIDGIAQLGPAQRAGDTTVFTATLESTDPFSVEARQVVDDIRSLPVPRGAELLVGGTTARNVDSLSATAAKLPWMVGMLVGATLILMFLAFGSILLPIKAVVMSALSLSATFGILVWIFQDGHGADWLGVTPAPLEAGIVVLMAAVVFGLSTDYEVFLLSRMVEARAHGATTKEAVTVGLARTGRVISAAALLLIVVTGAFALSSVTTMRFVGVGMIAALFLDATVVRMLLVPAVMGLLGNAVWWAPGPLKRLQERAGLAEHAGEETPALPSGRHAAGEAKAVLALPPGPSASAVKKKAEWDREAAGVLLLPPGMMPQALSSQEVATQVIPRVGTEPAGADDDVVDAEIIEDEPAAEAGPPAGDDDHVDAEIVDERQPAVAGDEPVRAEPRAESAEEAGPGSPEESASAEGEPAGADGDSAKTEREEPSAETGRDEPSAETGRDEPSAETERDEPSAETTRDEPSSAETEPIAAKATPAAETEPVAAKTAPAAETEPVAAKTAPAAETEPVAAKATPAAETEPVATDAEATSIGAGKSAGTDEPVLLDEPVGHVDAEPDVASPAPTTTTAEPDGTAADPPSAAAASAGHTDRARSSDKTGISDKLSRAGGGAAALPKTDVPALAEPVTAAAAAEPVTTNAAAEPVTAAAADEPVAAQVAGAGPIAVTDAAGEPVVAEVPDDQPAIAQTPDDEPWVAADEPVEAEIVHGETVEAELVEDDEPDPPLAAAAFNLPLPYFPEPGVYRSESVSKYTDYSAPDDFFFGPSSAGTFASSLPLPLPPEPSEPPVPYFGERPDFETTRRIPLPELDLTRSFDAPDLDATAIFEPPNREAVRAFESPDPATSGVIVNPELDPVSPAPEPAAAEPEPESDQDPAVTRSFDAPDLDATRKLQLPGLESTRRMPAPDVARARRLGSPAPAEPASAEPAPVAEAETRSKPSVPVIPPAPVIPPVPVASAEPLPRRPGPAAEPPSSPLEPPATGSGTASRLSELFPARRTAEADETPVRRRPTIFDEPAPVPEDPGPAPYDRPLPQRQAGEPLPRRRPAEPPLEPLPTRPAPLDEPSPLLRPATRGGRPYSVRPAEPSAPPVATPPVPAPPVATPPVTPTPVPAPPVATPPVATPPVPAPPVPTPPVTPTPVPAQRRPADLGDHLRTTRPADLGDHLRESRPADLAQYTRRPTAERKRPETLAEHKPARRPATLADQISAPRRKPDDEDPAE